VNRIALTIALAAAVLGAGLLLLYKRRFEHEVAGGPKVAVLVALKDLPLGARISEAHLGSKRLPEAYVEDRHVRISEAQTVVGVQASNHVKAGETVLWTDLATTSAHARNLGRLVKVGMRAVSIPVGDGVFGGLLRPGDRVDALLTSQDRKAGARQTGPIAQNLLVLAVGADLGAGEGNPRGRAGSVTIAVTMEEAQRLTLAMTEGHISLLLRNPDDLRVLNDQPETRSSEVRPGFADGNQAAAASATEDDLPSSEALAALAKASAEAARANAAADPAATRAANAQIQDIIEKDFEPAARDRGDERSPRRGSRPRSRSDQDRILPIH
jgi:pilus assembly protein CpaB